jgi:arsenite/tail-anchored protein-transporting ATPase
MRILLFTGKGGVGKTTMAAATALRLAERGCKTLLVSTDAAHSVGDAFGTVLGSEPTEVSPGLWAAQPDAQRQLEAAWRQLQHYFVTLLDRAGVDAVSAEELAVLPGIEEILALLAVRDLAVRGDWDTIVVDCAPTAETLRLLALPEALSWYLDKIFPAQRRLARGVRPFAALLGKADLLPPDTVFASLLALCTELESVRELLADQRVTSVRLVVTPEAMVVAEARRTFTALCLYGYQVDLVIANRVFPSTGPERESPWLQGWVRAQDVQLAAIVDSFAGVAVRPVRYAGAEPVGSRALQAIAGEIYGDYPGTDPAPPGAVNDQLRVERDGAYYQLTVSLPLAAAGEVEATRAGNDLVLTVAGRRRVVSLPSVLRRCDVVGARFADAQLRVRFRPDPKQWPEPDRSAP